MHRNRRVLALAFLAWSATGTSSFADVVPPPGYYHSTFATGLPALTSVAFGPDGWLYVTQLNGIVTAFRDRDGNGAADTTVTYATGFVTPLCVTPRNGDVYVSSFGQVTRLTDTNGDHVADVADTVLANLPTGRHWTTAIVFGPDGNMYVGNGSAGNLAVGNSWQAAILRFTPLGQFIDVYATGLRNPYDFAFNRDGQLFATDNGAGPDSTWNCFEAPDELNWIRAGQNYGFPDCFGTGDCSVQPECNPQPCGAGDCQTGTGCTTSMTAPIALFDAHSSSDGMAFGDNFKGYGRFDLFVAQFGQTEAVPNCETSHGHKIVRVRVRKQGQNWRADPPVDFATGFNLPLDVTVGPDSALYVADFTGTVIRIFATGAVSAAPDGPGGPPPSETALPAFRMSPNPAARSAVVQWSDRPRARASVQVFDISGRLVRRLSGGSSAGSGPVWDLMDSRGRRVPPGIYLVRATAGQATRTARLIVVN